MIRVQVSPSPGTNRKCIALFVVLLCLQKSIADIAIRPDPQCMPVYEGNPEAFDVCLYRPCFIFRSEIPYIFIDAKLNRTNDQTPFKCNDYQLRWPGNRGVFFEMVRNMPALNDSYCVFAGNQCSFNGMISFVNTTTATSRHQWIAGGVLFVLQNRILPGVIPSTSILQDYLHVVGPPQKDRQTFAAAFKLVLKPFSKQAWLIIFGVLFFFLVVRCLMIYMFGQAVGPHGFLRTLFLFNFQRDRRPRDAREEDWWRIINKHWGLAFVIFLSILVLLYEVALAVIAFESAGTPALVFSSAKEFAVYKDTTEEYFFEKLVDSTDQHSKFNTLDAVYTALKTNDTLKYTVSYRTDNRYEITRNPDLCGTLRLYDEVPPSLAGGRKPPLVTGAWFYSAGIPATKRADIDKDILKLKELDKITGFIDTAIGSTEENGKCAPNNNQIDGFMLFLLVSLPICYLVAICISLGIASIRKNNNTPEKQTHFEADRNENTSTLTTNSSTAAPEKKNKNASAPGGYSNAPSTKDRVAEFRRVPFY